MHLAYEGLNVGRDPLPQVFELKRRPGEGIIAISYWHGVSPTISHRLENVRHRVGKIATQAKHVNLVDINEEICLTTLVNRC